MTLWDAILGGAQWGGDRLEYAQETVGGVVTEVAGLPGQVVGYGGETVTELAGLPGQVLETGHDVAAGAITGAQAVALLLAAASIATVVVVGVGVIAYRAEIGATAAVLARRAL